MLEWCRVPPNSARRLGTGTQFCPEGWIRLFLVVLAMLIAGLLFGVALTVTVAAFGILSMDGQFAENLQAAANACLERITGRHARSATAVPARSIEADARIRGLQEEVRVQQRLMEQARVEREAQAEELRRASGEVESLRGLLAEREQQLHRFETELAEATAAAAKAREDMAGCSAELARSRRETRDLETELGIAQSGAGLGVFSDEIARLTRERDELKERLEQPTAHSPVAAQSLAARQR